MIALSIALGVVGLAAVLATWHVALRVAEPRVLAARADLTALRDDVAKYTAAVDAEFATLRARVEDVERDAADVREEARKVRLRRLGKGHEA